MNCDRIRNLFPDQWAGGLDSAAEAQLNAHLEGCDSCRQQFESLTRLWAGLAELPSEEPGATVRPRFYAMLEGYRQGLDQAAQSESPRGGIASWFTGGSLWRPALAFGFAVLLLVSGGLTGYFMRTSGGGREELADLRQEVHEMRRMVTMSLLKQQSASDRLKGVSWSTQLRHPDQEFLDALYFTLDHDPSVDVRLAAVDALARFAGEEAVRRDLVQSLRSQNSPLVQISVIDLLVQLHERSSIEALKELSNDPGQNQAVRQRAEWGLRILS